MPFRESEYREICSICDEQAAGPCVRCARPTCAEHHDSDDLCTACNEELERRFRTLVKPKVRIVIITVPAALAAALAILLLFASTFVEPGEGLLPLYLVGCVTITVGIIGLGHVLTKRARRIEQAVRRRQRERFIAGKD